MLEKTRFWERFAREPFNERQIKVLNCLLDGFEGKLTSSKWAGYLSQDLVNNPDNRPVTRHDDTLAIDRLSANRRLVEELYARGFLTANGRRAALEFLHPHTQWALWISRLLLVVGSALVLSGVVYFFAYNWILVPSAVKLGSVQLGVIAAVAAACYYGLKAMGGQVLLLGASVIVGVFLAVFGQIYQTGADAYQLFLTWSVLILGFSAISNFAPQWTLWLAVTNTALVLWWQQAALPTYEMNFLIFAYLALLNGAALGLREWCALRGVDWVAARWTRVLLTLVTLGVLLIPVLWLITSSDGVRNSVLLTGIIGLIGHLAFYAVYRHVLRDMWALAATVLSGCLILEAAAYRAVLEAFSEFAELALFSLGWATLIIFSGAIVYLRSIMSRLRVSYA